MAKRNWPASMPLILAARHGYGIRNSSRQRGGRAPRSWRRLSKVGNGRAGLWIGQRRLWRASAPACKKQNDAHYSQAQPADGSPRLWIVQTSVGQSGDDADRRHATEHVAKTESGSHPPILPRPKKPRQSERLGRSTGAAKFQSLFQLPGLADFVFGS